MYHRHARSGALALLLAGAVVLATGALATPQTAGSGGLPDATSSTLPSSPPLPSTTSTAPATGLDRGLVAALEAATAEARQAGHRLSVTSGFRTVAEQNRLLAEAIDEHGTRDAYRWVFPPDRSMHVRGLAVDVGDGPAASWLDEHGARFGLCRTLAWEWWHFEWRSAWEASSSCPGPVDDPAEAPQ